MRQFTVLAFVLGVLLHEALAFPFVLQLDLTPEQAQEYLKDPPGAIPNLAPKTATLPLVKFSDPRFRSGESGPTNGHYWRNGHEIVNTDDFVEEVYDASQFHGQDGLGAFAYGYSGPDSFKAEQRERDGNVRGYYAYRNPGDWNNLIKVNYWADHEGFHQEDNLPKYQPEAVQETPEVREARLAHEKAWQEAAAAAAVNPDPHGEYDPSAYEYEGRASDKNVVSLNPNLPEDLAKLGAPARNAKALLRQDENLKEQNEEPTGPPRGFFYSFHYPVSVLSLKSDLESQARAFTGHPTNADSVDQDIRNGAGPHDAQIPRRAGVA